MGLKQAWKALFQKERAEEEPTKRETRHEFDDLDRLHATEMRRIRQEFQRMTAEMQRTEMQKRLNDLKHQAGIYTDDDEDDEEEEEETDLDMVAKLMGSIFNSAGIGKQLNNVMPSGIGASTANFKETDISMSDEEIRAFIAKNDRKYINIAKALPKEVLKSKVKKEMNVTEDTAERAHKILVTEF